MPSIRETVLETLKSTLAPIVLGTVRRDDGSAALIPTSGTGALVTIEDGTQSGTPILSPLCYAIEHEVPITIEASSRTDMDNAAQAVAGIVQTAPTLSGAVEWIAIEDFDATAEQPEGERNVAMPRVFTGTVSIRLFYTAPSVGG